ncbi:DUF6241 domain-containing protein [Ornithinibacillus salinisoli]|uniref:DUF6241 domain-containing protein n=1 Tax=Ornithinibacillus salinisoli TaxID=1848459 RepID=A0ABW4VW73_9BACI
MYKVILTVLSISAVVLIAYAGWSIYNIFTDEEDKADAIHVDSDKELAELEDQRIEIQGSISEEDLDQYENKNLNPFGQAKEMNELTDNIYQEYIHGMSHQKVIASEKWGFYEIHLSRVQWLLDGLNEVNLEYEDVYRSILEKWLRGDFSTADADHNRIWQIQGGTIGEATGVYSPEEEKAYLESQSSN